MVGVNGVGVPIHDLALGRVNGPKPFTTGAKSSFVSQIIPYEDLSPFRPFK